MKLTRRNSPYHSHRGVDGQPSHLVYRAGNFLLSWIEGTEKEIDVCRTEKGEAIKITRNGSIGFLFEGSYELLEYLKGYFNNEVIPVHYEVDGKRIFDGQDLPAFFLPTWARGRVWFITAVKGGFQAGMVS